MTEDETGQNKTTAQAGPDESPFGPWVLVARKRKLAKRTIKDSDPLTQSSNTTQSPTRPTNALSPTTGFATLGLDANKRSQSSTAVLAVGVLRSENDNLDLRLDQSKSKAHTPKSKNTGRSQKAKLTQTG